MRNTTENQPLMAATRKILGPLIRILIRYGVGYPVFISVAKQVYLDVAKADFVIPGKRQTASRLSTITGLSRKEVARLEDLATQGQELDTRGVNRAARVISGWVRDEQYHAQDGSPADLPFDSGTVSFSSLVKQYSGDITARTIADELIRVGAVTMDEKGMVHLNTRAYIPGADHTDSLTILGTDVAALLNTIDHNIEQPDNPYLQRKVAYTHIPEDVLVTIRPQLAQMAQSNLEAMDKLLAKNVVKKRKVKLLYLVPEVPEL